VGENMSEENAGKENLIDEMLENSGDKPDSKVGGGEEQKVMENGNGKLNENNRKSPDQKIELGGRGSSTEYHKVDFKGKVLRGYGGYILSIVVIFVIILIGVWVLLSNFIFPTISEMGFVLIYSFATGFPLVFFLWVGCREFKRFMKSGSPKIFLDFSLTLIFIGFFAFMVNAMFIRYYYDTWEEVIWPILFVMCNIPFLEIIITAGILYSCWAYSKGSLLGLYPQVIASAERETDEYLDGYSDRPYNTTISNYETNAPGIDIESFALYARFLMKHLVIYDYFAGEKSIKLEFPRAIKVFFLQKPEQSWMNVRKDGRVTIYITPSDYEFLKVPISHHLLCEKTWERIWSAYELFQIGKKKEALEVFRVERVKNTKMDGGKEKKKEKPKVMMK